MKASAYAATLLSLALAGSALANVGVGFIQIPGIAGGWRAGNYRGWTRIESRYWGLHSVARANGTGPRRARPFFSGPAAPREASELVISVGKRSPALAPLMKQCAMHAEIPEVLFAESADDYRDPALELGDRPAGVPRYFEYKLRDVQFADCPVAAAAPEQAFVLKFRDIELLNYHGTGKGVDIPLAAAPLAPAQVSGQVKTFIVNWFGFAHDVSSDQCPTMNAKPKPEDFGRTPAQVAAQSTDASNPMEFRGPGGLNVCLLPGAAPDPGNVAPRSKFARGLNMAPNGGCKHKNYESEDGRAGIDNQFYTVAGCIAGLQGKKGLWQQVLNEEWRSGAVSLLIQISGIDDEKNDDNVDVTLLYSLDPAAKEVSGKEILPNYTFRVTDKPEFTHFFVRLHARIVNGVIITEKTPRLDFDLVKGPTLRLSDAQLRLQLTSDGNLKGVLGGFEDWRYLANYYDSVGFEVVFGFQCPAFYNALKRAADGMKDPDTGECNQISSAYDIEAIPAHIPPSQLKFLMGQSAARESER